MVAAYMALGVDNLGLQLTIQFLGFMNTDEIIHQLNSGSLSITNSNIIETGEQSYYQNSSLMYAILANGDRIHKSPYNPSWVSMGNNADYLGELALMNDLIDKGEI